MSITLADIDSAENAVQTVRKRLDAIGRELYKMREGLEIGSGYGFDRYYRTKFGGQHYLHQEGPDWGVGTPIFSLTYYWGRGEDTISVTFPQSWLESDWRALEQDRLNKESAARSELEEIEAKQRAAEQEESDRSTFERLKEKFEGNGLSP